MNALAPNFRETGLSRTGNGGKLHTVRHYEKYYSSDFLKV